jgi:S-adenosyl methyltransferase
LRRLVIVLQATGQAGAHLDPAQAVMRSGIPDALYDWRTTFPPDIPSSARIYDYSLGGKDNYPADRDAGDQITAYLYVDHDPIVLTHARSMLQVLARSRDCHYHALVARKP